MMTMRFFVVAIFVFGMATMVESGSFLSERNVLIPSHAEDLGKNQDYYCSACLLFARKFQKHITTAPNFAAQTRYTSKARKAMVYNAADESVKEMRAKVCDYMWPSPWGRGLGCPEDVFFTTDPLGAKKDPSYAMILSDFITRIHTKKEKILDATKEYKSLQDITETWPDFICHTAISACKSKLQMIAEVVHQ